MLIGQSLKPVTVHVTTEVLAELRHLAQQDGITVPVLVLRAVDEHCKAQADKTQKP